MSDSKSKYVPNWNQTIGKATKTENGILVHPYDLISLAHKKKGLDYATKLAQQVLKKKYDRIFDEAKTSEKK